MIDRKKYNKEILKFLDKLVDEYPDIRFNQLLCNLGLNSGDRYDEEPNKTLEYIYKNFEFSQKYMNKENEEKT